MRVHTQPPPTLELPGARLRPLRREDAADLYAYLREPAVTELTSFPEVTMPFAEGMIDRAMNRWAAGELSKWGLVLPPEDQVVGTCGFNEWSAIHRWAELAYDLAPQFWGRGLASQAVAAVLRWAFEQDKIDRVQAYVRLDNLRSQALLERTGFVQEGCLRSFRICRGRPFDFLVYGQLQAEWVAAVSSSNRLEA